MTHDSDCVSAGGGADGEFSFDLLDQLVDAAKAEGLCVMLGTPTATMPAWLYSQHPDVAMQGTDGQLTGPRA